MRDPARIDAILKELERVWKASPDMRLCQLIEGLVFRDHATDHCFFHVEDDMVLAELERKP